MSNEVIKNSEIPHAELLFLYEEKTVELKRERDINWNLKDEIKRLEHQIAFMKQQIQKALT